MEIEFHYFITKGIALRAGFNEDQAEIIAHASQLTDDNVRQYCINRGKPDEYRNYISFTYNILKPRKTLSHIYPIFHFVPGDPDSKSAARIDRRKNRFNTTPDSKNARGILNKAFEDGSLYRVGIAVHAFADTWAHQNFTGFFDGFNAFKGLPEMFSPNIGHADAGNKPEYVAFRWKDRRLKNEFQAIDNNQRFLAASQRIFEELCRFKGKAGEWIEKQWRDLKGDLDEAFGKPDQTQRLKQARIKNYKKLLGVESGYKKDLWFKEAVKTGLPGIYDFKNGYKKSNWFLFQQDVIKHQDDAYKILEKLFEATGQKNDWVDA